MVARQMQRIQGIFREVQEHFNKEYSLPQLCWQLDNYDAEFRSVAYEAASMCIALIDLKEGSELKRWKEFLKDSGGKHNTQIHIGLGWALAQQSLLPAAYLPELTPMMRYRVLDGYGYYDGFFRKRKRIMAQQKPDFKDATASGAYDQGLGRSIWYLNNGEINEAEKTLTGFPPERQKDLWRGLGIAVAYVGGLDETMVKEILSASGKHKASLAAGVAMSVISRQNSDSINEDTERICHWVCGEDVSAVVAKDETIKASLDSGNDSCYKNWFKQLETLFEN